MYPSDPPPPDPSSNLNMILPDGLDLSNRNLLPTFLQPHNLLLILHFNSVERPAAVTDPTPLGQLGLDVPTGHTGGDADDVEDRFGLGEDLVHLFQRSTGGFTLFSRVSKEGRGEMSKLLDGGVPGRAKE